MGKLPMVTVVKINKKLYSLDGFNIGCIYIHPINRTAVKFIKRRISGNNLNCRCIYTGLHFNKSDYYRLISHIVTDFKFYAMNTVCNCDIRYCHSTICISYINFHTVDICLCAGQIKAGSISLCSIFSNKSRQSKQVAFSNYSFIFFKLDGRIVSCKLYLAEYRSFSIINRIREICSNVIDINSLKTIYGSIFLPKSVGIGMREHELDKSEVVSIILRSIVPNLIPAIKTRNKNFIIFTYINREISPAGLIHSIIYFGLVDDANCILGFELTVIVRVYPVQYTDPTMLVFIRNISPETYRLCIFDNHTVIKEKVRLSVSTGRNTFGRYGVHFYPHRTVSVMNLTVFGCSKAKMLIEAFIITVYVSNVPCIDICGIFESKENLRPFTQIKNRSSYETCVMYKSSCKCAIKIVRCVRFAYRGKL